MLLPVSKFYIPYKSMEKLVKFRNNCTTWWNYQTIANHGGIHKHLHNMIIFIHRIKTSNISSKFWLKIRHLQILHSKNKAKQLFITMNFKILCTVYIYDDVQLVLSLEKLSKNRCIALFLECNIWSCLIWSQKYSNIICYFTLHRKIHKHCERF